MYSFPYFKEKDQQVLRDFLEKHPFAFLTGSNANGEQVATQLPLLVEERQGDLFLQGHIMRHTDHYKTLRDNPKALVVFTGPSCYVSASWYSQPQQGSTWNYMSVHVHGEVRMMSDAELTDFIRKLTLKFEGGNSASPTYMDNLPANYVQAMMPAIAGFEIKADKLEHVFKLSQNRDEASYLNIITRLEALGGESALIAAEMKARYATLFQPSV